MTDTAFVPYPPFEELTDLLLPALVARRAFVEVPMHLFHQFPHTDHPMRWPWILGLNDHESCGAYMDVADRFTERWCLLPSEHKGEHGWQPETLGAEGTGSE